MTNQQREDFLRRPDLYDPSLGVSVTFDNPMTDRAKLAEKIYVAKMQGMGAVGNAVNFKQWSEVAIDAANIFFDQLEGNTDE
jgi:hypothetical protein